MAQMHHPENGGGGRSEADEGIFRNSCYSCFSNEKGGQIFSGGFSIMLQGGIDAPEFY